MDVNSLVRGSLGIPSERMMSPIDSEKELWSTVLDEFKFDRKKTEEYMKTKNPDYEVSSNPEVDYLDHTVLPLLKKALIEMLQKLKAADSFYHRKTTLIGLDYVAEFLYNMNPKYPARQCNWTYIFDMPWVEQYLKEKPRPHYAFHLIWSRDFAAKKIQSHMRGHWVRCLPQVQELRLFWKTLRADRR